MPWARHLPDGFSQRTLHLGRGCREHLPVGGEGGRGRAGRIRSSRELLGWGCSGGVTLSWALLCPPGLLLPSPSQPGLAHGRVMRGSGHPGEAAWKPLASGKQAQEPPFCAFPVTRPVLRRTAGWFVFRCHSDNERASIAFVNGVPRRLVPPHLRRCLLRQKAPRLGSSLSTINKSLLKCSSPWEDCPAPPAVALERGGGGKKPSQ